MKKYEVILQAQLSVFVTAEDEADAEGEALWEATAETLNWQVAEVIEEEDDDA